MHGVLLLSFSTYLTYTCVCHYVLCGCWVEGMPAVHSATNPLSNRDECTYVTDFFQAKQDFSPPPPPQKKVIALVTLYSLTPRERERERGEKGGEGHLALKARNTSCFP